MCENAVEKLRISYPVAIDNNYAIWRAFDNEYWPAHYFIDAEGRIRHHHFGEGEYDESERVIQTAACRSGRTGVSADSSRSMRPAPRPRRICEDVGSRETYIGSIGQRTSYRPAAPSQDSPCLFGRRCPVEPVGPDRQLDDRSRARTPQQSRWKHRFQVPCARPASCPRAPGLTANPIRFRVTIDGAAPGDDHGTDVDADGDGAVNGERLYQLIRQRARSGTAFLRSSFSTPSVQAYAFTFG